MEGRLRGMSWDHLIAKIAIGRGNNLRSTECGNLHKQCSFCVDLIILMLKLSRNQNHSFFEEQNQVCERGDTLYT